MQKISKRRLAKAVSLAFLAVGVPSAARAVEVGDRLEIHGYGHQGYLQSKDNTYLNADDKGTWDYNALALVFAVKINDKTKIWSQLHSTSEKTRLDWAYVDHQLTGNLTGRAGQIKMPFGLYNEIRDIKFLQLSTLEPMLYQEASEMVQESFRGVSAIYNRSMGGGSLSWDAYLGQVTEWQEESGTGHKSKRLVGGRVAYQTPVEGLKFMASAYNSAMKDTAQVPVSKGNRKTWALSTDYANNNFDVKAEYAKMKFFSEESKTYYVQAGYTFAEKWTPYVRYDYITTDVAEKTDPAHYQKAKVLGLNYKINNSVAVRLENHWNSGYALPVASKEVAAGAGKIGWNMFAVSVNFIF
ncbi:MAG: porin [Burkholderiales bacterium]